MANQSDKNSILTSFKSQYVSKMIFMYKVRNGFHFNVLLIYQLIARRLVKIYSVYSITYNFKTRCKHYKCILNHFL